MAFYDTSNSSPQDSEITSPALKWKESSPGVWTRGLDECEQFFRLSKRAENHSWPVYGFASFAVEPCETLDEEKKQVHTAFKKAWWGLRHRHPSLASQVKYNTENHEFTRIYSIPREEADKNSWLESTFKMTEIETDPLEWFNEEMPNTNLTTMFLIRSSQDKTPRFTIILQSPHDITDGAGIPHLMHQLFEYAIQAYDQGDAYMQPEWGSEGTRLSPCLKIAAKMPDTLSESQNKQLNEVLQKNEAVWNHPRLLCIPSSRKPTDAPSRRQRIPLSLSKETTTKILSACKCLGPGITITHLLTGAIGLAVSQLQPKKTEPYLARFVSLSMINLRPYCQPPYDSPDHAAAAYHCISARAFGLDFKIPSLSTTCDESYPLSQVTTDVRDHYRVMRPFISDEMHEQVYLAPSMWEIFTPKLGQDINVVSSETPFSNVPISSIGDISKVVSANYGCFNVEKVWVSSEPVGADVAVFIGTWDQQLELAAVFDNKYQDVEYIRGFLERIVQIVCKGLSIE